MRVRDGGLVTTPSGGLGSPGVASACLRVSRRCSEPRRRADPAGDHSRRDRPAPDVPPRAGRPWRRLPPDRWNLDGTYLWLGPSRRGELRRRQWDSTFGGDVAVMRVREHEPLGAVGGTLGASRWTDARRRPASGSTALVGTAMLGHMVGVSAGPIVELAELRAPAGSAARSACGRSPASTPYVARRRGRRPRRVRRARRPHRPAGVPPLTTRGRARRRT